MSNRHLARTIAMQTLYEWDFNGRTADDIVGLLHENFKQFAPDFSDQGFSEALIRGVMEHRDAIDATITKYAPEWPLEQITIVDRNVLRLGVYELTYAPDVPPKVAINEAIANKNAQFLKFRITPWKRRLAHKRVAAANYLLRVIHAPVEQCIARCT